MTATRGNSAGPLQSKPDGEEPSALSTPMHHQRLRAPRGDREVLALPPLDSVGQLLAHVDRAARCQYDVQGRSLCDLSALARHELLTSARQYTSCYRDVEALSAGDRILLAGHQPQLFHPGVWFKNFALGSLARSHQATAVNLVIDTDTLKDASLRVPGGTVDEPVARMIPFDDSTVEMPFARRQIRNRRVFAGFGRTAADWQRSLVGEPLLDTFWPKVVARSREIDHLGQCLAQARHQVEGEWGNATLELPQTRVCQFEAFHWFAAHLLAQLPRFVEIYNEAIAEYRLLHGIRSLNHPVPQLVSEGDWLEAPFWLANDARADRRHLFVRRRGADMILSDRQTIEVRVPLADDRDAGRAVAALATLAERGLQLQTRALTTTLFARLFLGDLFIHGIGGGKYDQLTDVLIRRFFLLEPPPLMVLSATLYLPVEGHQPLIEDAAHIQQRLRDLEYHPERYLDGNHFSSDDARRIADLVALKRRWVQTPQTKENARQRCRAIRSANESLQAWLAEARRRWLALRDDAARIARAEGILRWREYAFCLYPEATLRDFFASIPPAEATRPT